MNKPPTHLTTYDADGNLKTVTQPDGLTTTYSYDTLNRLNLEVVKDSGGNTVASYTYTLRADGLRTSVLEHQENVGGGFTDTLITYTYDADGRLTSEDHDDGNNGPSSGDETIT